MNYKALFKALKFACLPTLSILMLLFFGFFSITKTIDFISSDNGWAVFLRVVAFILETALIVHMYYQYIEEDLARGALETGQTISIRYDSQVRSLFAGGKSDDYKAYITDNPNVIIIKHKK